MRRDAEQLKFPTDTGDRVTANMGLIGSVLRRNFPWLTAQFSGIVDDLRAVGMVSLAKAHRDFDPAKGAYSTLATKYMVNDFLKYAEKLQRRSRRRIRGGVESCGLSERREMRPDVACVTNETVSRNTPISMFGEDECEAA